MSQTVSLKDHNFTYTAKVERNPETSSPVTVTSGDYVVTFDGNNFSTKHLRLIRQNSVKDLKSKSGGGKVEQYSTEAKSRAKERWRGNEDRTNSYVFLDLMEFCKLGCAVIKVAAADVVWVPFGNQQVLQFHTDVTLNNCLASSNSGRGMVRNAGGDDRVECGVGITMSITVQQVDGNPKHLQVCHYGGGDVVNTFKKQTNMSKTGQQIVN